MNLLSRFRATTRDKGVASSPLIGGFLQRGIARGSPKVNLTGPVQQGDWDLNRSGSDAGDGSAVLVNTGSKNSESNTSVAANGARNGTKRGSAHPRTADFLPGPSRLEAPLCRVVLVEPLIPENTGNISRTCVGLNTELHLIRPLGFEITEGRVKRAGLDYWEHLALTIHDSFADWVATVESTDRVFFVETTGRTSIFEAQLQKGDWLVFGKETTGLQSSHLEAFGAMPPGRDLHLPMTGPIRSLNLSNAVAVSVFELFRQVGAAPS